MKDLYDLIFKNLKPNDINNKNSKELKFLNEYLSKEFINFEFDEFTKKNDEFTKKKMDLEDQRKKIKEKIQTMVDQRQSNPDAITQWLEHDNVSLEHQWSLIFKLWCCKNSKNDPQIQAWTSQFQNKSLQNKGHLGLLRIFQSAPWNESSWSPWVSFLYDWTHECIQHQTKDLKEQQKLLCDTYRHWASSAASTQCWSHMEALLDPKLVKHQETMDFHCKEDPVMDMFAVLLERKISGPEMNLFIEQNVPLNRSFKRLCHHHQQTHWIDMKVAQLEKQLLLETIQSTDTKGASIHHNDIESESLSKPPLRL